MKNIIIFNIIILLIIKLSGQTFFRRQSPISLYRREAWGLKKGFRVPAINFNNYDILMDLYGENNGYTTSFIIPEKYQSQITLEHDMIRGTYKAVGFHFHWGRTEREGAEHLVEGKRHSMELHIVHINTNYTLAEAYEHEDGFVGIGILYKASSFKSSFYDRISQQVNNLIEYRSKTLIKNFSLNNFMKTVNKNDFFLYKGSLTTPPYSESAVWLVMTDIQTVGIDELKIYRKLKKSDGNLINSNYRNLFPINGRKIYKREEL